MAQSQRRFDAVIDAPFGRVGLVFRDQYLVDLDLLTGATPLTSAKSVAARRAVAQLRGYFRDPGRRLHIPLSVEGTPFQRRVWRALRRIRPGATLGYGELARRLKSSARAVGNACRRNPVAIVIPCHRVVAANGDGGFMGKRRGKALAIKRWLLEHERGR